MSRLSVLERVLCAVGQATVLCELSDGSRLLLLPHGGRVIGLFPATSDENFLWTNPALDSALSAAELFGSKEWRNTGGDRTWISPEIDVFCPRFPDTSYFRTPEELDSRDFAVEADGAFANRFTLELSRSHRVVEIGIRKWWSEVACPMPARLMEGVEFAGYRQHVALEAAPSDPDVSVSLWMLLQVKPGGEAVVEVREPVRPRLYFGEIGAGELTTSCEQVRYRFGRAGIHKIGLPAHATPGSIAYWRSEGERAELIVRRVEVEPLADYIDVPWTESGALLEPGDAIQLCTVNNGLGCFGELEHHAPAGRGDVSELLAFRGPRGAIERIAGMLAG